MQSLRDYSDCTDRLIGQTHTKGSETAMTQLALEARDIRKSYGRGQATFEALKGVSLAIEAGEAVAIVGKSGSGKSTLMHLLALLDTPDDGSLLIDGSAAGDLQVRQVEKIRNEAFGFVFQQFFLIPQASVLDNVVLPLKIAGVGARERKERGMAALRQLGIEDKATNKAVNLSGGQKQRVVIARALINDPKVIFADEPTGNLDTRDWRARRGHPVRPESRARDHPRHRDPRHRPRGPVRPPVLYPRRPVGLVARRPHAGRAGRSPKGTLMKIKDIISTAIGNSFRSRLRTTLTVIAIFVGAFTLTLTSSIGTGITSYIDTQVASIGASNVLTVRHATDDATATTTGPAVYDPAAATAGASGAAGFPGGGGAFLPAPLTDADVAAIGATPGITWSTRS